jgi:site-specific DNA recombinase
MLEEALSDMVKLHLKQALQKMQIAPLIKSHEVATALRALEQLSMEQVLGLIAHVDLSAAVLIIKLNHEALVNHLSINQDDLDHEYLSFEQPVTFQRRSNGTKMVWATYKSEPNHALIRAIVQARSWVEKLKAGKSVTDITASEGISEGRLSKRIRLAFLSPKLVTAILDGTTGQELTIKKLSSKDIPLNWEEQHVRFLC